MFYWVGASDSFFFKIDRLVPSITCAWTTLMQNIQEGNWTCSIFFHLCMVLVILGLEWTRVGVLHPGCHLSCQINWNEGVDPQDLYGLSTLERERNRNSIPRPAFQWCRSFASSPFPATLSMAVSCRRRWDHGSSIACRAVICSTCLAFQKFSQEIQPEDGKIVDVWWHIGSDDFDALRRVKTPLKCRCLKWLCTAQIYQIYQIWSQYLWSKLWNISELWNLSEL